MDSSPPVPRPPLPPFTRESAVQKVRAAEDGWNSRNPERVALAYSAESRWRNRAEFLQGARRSPPSSRASGRESSIIA